MHWFIDPIQNQYADFEGRTTRKEYWMFWLISVLLSVAVAMVAEMIRMQLIATFFSLAILVPSIAIAARRLHDIGKSGWWQLIGLIPIIGTIILIVWLATKSEGDNQYGAARAMEASAMDSVPQPAPEAPQASVPASDDTQEQSQEKEEVSEGTESATEENKQQGFGN